MKNMKVLYLSAEVAPFVAVGGLSQVSYFLPKSLKKKGVDIRAFTPKFGAMEVEGDDKKKWKLKTIFEGLKVPIENEVNENSLICNIKLHESKNGAITYFLENREYYELRANVFGYKDDHIRFLLMCKGCLEWLVYQKDKGEWFPDIIHANDWHSAYIIELARKNPRYRKIFEKTKLVLTVHNFAYQGNYDFKYCSINERDDGKSELVGIFDPKLQTQNALLRGVMYADAINTVSPTHAKEVLTEEYGEGLSKVLREKQSKISGILNGLDTDMYDPAKDQNIKAKFDATNFVVQRKINKMYLQKLFGLSQDNESCLIVYVGRLAQQKGIETILGALPHLLNEYSQAQIIVMGGGEEMYRRQLASIQKKYSKQIGLHLLPDFTLPKKLFAGADVLLLPSMFEPGGIVALEGLRYGAVPIVRRTGGLNDIVKDFYPSFAGNGFSFSGRDSWSLYGAIVRAMTIFSHKKTWYKLVQNCLESDYSWDNVSKKYQNWYKTVRIEK